MWLVQRKETPLSTLGIPSVLRSAYDQLFSEQYGIVCSGEMHRFRCGPATFWMANSRLARYPIGAFYRPIEQSETGGGYSVEPVKASTRCVGELIERYSALTEPCNRAQLLPVGNSEFFDKLPRTIITEGGPDDFRLENPKLEVQQTLVRRVEDDSEVFVPSDHVHLARSWREGPPIAVPVSSGHAYHTSHALARASGIREVLERDALMISWLNQRTAGRIDPNGLSKSSQFWPTLAFAEALGARVTFHDLDVGLNIPIVLAVLRTNGVPYVSAGLCAANDPEDALVRALEEACAFFLGSLIVKRKPITSPEEIQSIQDHSDFYATNNLPHVFEFLDASEQLTFKKWSQLRSQAIPLESQEQKVFAAQLRHEHDLTWCYHDLPPMDAGIKGYVVKSVVPECVPLSSPFAIRWLGTPRLLSKMAEYGRTTVNSNPHPFG